MGQNADRYPASWESKFRRRRTLFDWRRGAILRRSAACPYLARLDFTSSSCRYDSSHLELSSPSSSFRQCGQRRDHCWTPTESSPLTKHATSLESCIARAIPLCRSPSKNMLRCTRIDKDDLKSNLGLHDSRTAQNVRCATVYFVLDTRTICAKLINGNVTNMNAWTTFIRRSARSSRIRNASILRSYIRQSSCPKCGRPSPPIQRRFAHIPAEDPNFTSIVDNPPNLVKTGNRHGPGLIILGAATRHTSPASELTILSPHPHHRICPGKLAGPTARVEDGTARQTRRPPSAASVTITAADRPGRDCGFRLPESLCHWALSTRPGDADRTADT